MTEIINLTTKEEEKVPPDYHIDGMDTSPRRDPRYRDVPSGTTEADASKVFEIDPRMGMAGNKLPVRRRSSVNFPKLVFQRPGSISKSRF